MKRLLATLVAFGVLAAPAQAGVPDGTWLGRVSPSGNMKLKTKGKQVTTFSYSKVRVQCGNRIFHISITISGPVPISHRRFTFRAEGQGGHSIVHGTFHGNHVNGTLHDYGKERVTEGGVHRGCDTFKQPWGATRS